MSKTFRQTAAYYKADGAVAIFADADVYCIECAIKIYGNRVEDSEGNPLSAVSEGSDDLHGQYCMGDCYELLRQGKRTDEDNRLCAVDCECYQDCKVAGYVTNYDFYCVFGRFPNERENASGKAEGAGTWQIS